MIQCLCCKGSGKMPYTVYENKKETKMEMDCISCDGKGEMTAKELKVYNFEQNMWCKCETETEVKFYDNDEHDEIYKHHYRCRVCDKVVQIG